MLKNQYMIQQINGQQNESNDLTLSIGDLNFGQHAELKSLTEPNNWVTSFVFKAKISLLI